MKPEQAWRSVLGEIEVTAGRNSYMTWLRNARLLTYEDGQFVIGLPNGYAKEWIEQRMLSDLKRMLSERLGRSAELTLVVMSHAGGESVTLREPALARTDDANDGLQKRYTFEAFVVGSGNRMAHAAAMAVAEAPAERLQPALPLWWLWIGQDAPASCDRQLRPPAQLAMSLRHFRGVYQ
jgi:chromosomal replication initiator protein